MAKSLPPDPEDRDYLSPREWEILDRIEDDLLTSDPTLAHQFARHRPRIRLAWWPISWRATTLLLTGLVVLVIAANLVPASWSFGIGLLAGGFTAGWILVCVREQKNAGHIAR